MKVKREYDAVRADPSLKAFVNAIRARLDKEPLYGRRPRTELERFYIPPMQLPAAPKRFSDPY